MFGNSFGTFTILCSRTVVVAQTKSVFEEGEMVPDKTMLKRAFFSFDSCLTGFAYCKLIIQVDGTWLYGKYTGTLLIVTSQTVLIISSRFRTPL